MSARDPTSAPDTAATYGADEPGRAVSDLPQRIGPYRVLALLAHGGMGTVYVAEQTVPVQRRVAVKVIKLGMDTREVVARFEAERQALAVMEHPGIARVLDGGATADGRPYFVMELVKGVSITEYCDVHRLSTRERLLLFVDVCHAVQHAHLKGVIHRDLKPSNILVMLQDGVPVPKVIDFGIAKALSGSLTERSLLTDLGRTVGTPAYMSPEQADPSALDVDTRTDVYSLGVVLYELLVGRLPLDPLEVGLDVYFMRLASREVSPHTPSARVSTLGNDAGAVSLHRGSDPRTLRREIRGDLDWIVMKALEPNRTRRYETVNALAVDVLRHLNNEPVFARPPSTLYRLTRFTRRHRAGVVASAAVLAALVAGLWISTTATLRARRAEARAREQAATSERVAGFLTDLFRVSEPDQARGDSLTAREILDRGADRISTELAADPLVQARMMHTIGNTYRELGLFAKAQPLLEQAVAIQGARLDASSPALLASVVDLAQLAEQQGRFVVAESLYARAVATQEAAYGADDPRLARALSEWGGMRVTQGRYASAESLLTRALALRERDTTPADLGEARLLRYLASAYLAQGKFAEAEPAFRRVVDMYERVPGGGSNHPDVGRALNNLGIVYYYLNRYDDAEQYYRLAEANLSRNLGPDHPNIASIDINLGEIAWRRGRFADARARLERALAILTRRVAPNHPSIGTAELDLANVARDEGNRAEANRRYSHALRIREAAFGATAPPVAEVLTEYARLERAMGNTRAASDMETRARAITAHRAAEP